jgi:hypothetical protein
MRGMPWTAGFSSVRRAWAAARMAVFALLGALGLSGCLGWPFGGESPEFRPQPAQALKISIDRRRLGEPTVCAVTGKPFAISVHSRSARFRSQTFFLGDDEALQAFLAQPDQYVADPPASP